MEQALLEFREMTSQYAELLDHMGVLLVWLLDYAERNKIPLDQALGFHIARTHLLVKELSAKNNQKLLTVISDASYHDNDSDASDANLPEPEQNKTHKQLHRIIKMA